MSLSPEEFKARSPVDRNAERRLERRKARDAGRREEIIAKIARFTRAEPVRHKSILPGSFEAGRR